MKKLEVHKQLERTPMIGNFTPNEFIVLIVMSVFVFMAFLTIDQYVTKIPIVYVLIIISLTVVVLVWVKSHFKGFNLIEYFLFLRSPKLLKGSIFKKKHTQQDDE